MSGKYRIVRNFQNGTKRTVERGLSLDEAQRHCRDAQTSSKTCTDQAGKARTKRLGPWFDGYEAE